VVKALEAKGCNTLFVTFTAKAQHGETANEAMRRVSSWWRIFRKNTRRASWLVGGIRRTECTLRHPVTGAKRPHAHIHVVAQVSNAPANAREWLVERWLDVVRRESGNAKTAVAAAQDIQAVTDVTQTQRYVLKYAVKAESGDAADVLLAMQGQRVMQTWGAWHGRSKHELAAVARETIEKDREEGARWSCLTMADVEVAERDHEAIREESLRTLALGAGYAWKSSEGAERALRWSQLPVNEKQLRILAGLGLAAAVDALADALRPVPPIESKV
jgi:hypothetical protein